MKEENAICLLEIIAIKNKDKVGLNSKIKKLQKAIRLQNHNVI